MEFGDNSRLGVIFRRSSSTEDAKFATTSGVVQFSEPLELEVEDIGTIGSGAISRLQARRIYKAIREDPSSPPACLMPTSTTVDFPRVKLPAFEMLHMR